MSIVVASGETISRNLLNHSASKQMYSFSKTPRFHQLRRCTSATFLYDIPNKMSKRKAYIGYGIKSDFTTTKKTNSPYYKVQRMFEGPRLFEGLLAEAPKYSFGLGRNYFQKCVIGNKTSKIETISPGPGRYSYLVPFGNFSPQYSVPKNSNNLAGLGKVVSPGPAKYYNCININPQGKYTLSKFVNTPKAPWSMARSNRFKYYGKII